MNNKNKYQTICKIEKSISVFSQPYWLDAACGEENWDVILYENKGEIIAAMPYSVKKYMGLSYIAQPRFIQTLGPWIKYPQDISPQKKLSYEKEAMNIIIEYLEKLPIVFFQQCFSRKITNWLPFYWKGYKQTTRYTYRIEDISDIEMVFNNFHYSKQKHIKQALKQDLIIGFDLSAREFYNNHCLTLRKNGKIISYSYDLFEKIYTAAYANNIGKTIYAKDQNGNLHSALFVIWDHESGYNLISTIDPDFRTSRSSTLLALEIIRFLSNKTRSFDFEGSMIENVEYSFSKFGTIQTQYFCIWKIFTKNPLVRFIINTKL